MNHGEPRKQTRPRIETFTHDQARRCNIPTAELQALMREDEATPRKGRLYGPREVLLFRPTPPHAEGTAR